MVEVGQ